MCFHGLKEGSEVAVHYTAKGGRATADEVDHICKDGLKVTEGTISHSSTSLATSIGQPHGRMREPARSGAAA
jgi:hypothetical protein